MQSDYKANTDRQQDDRALPPWALSCLTNVYPASIQPLHGNAEALPFGTQPVANWNNAVLKDDSPSWLGVPAHLGKNKATSRLPERQHSFSSQTELPSPLSTPRSHCQAAAERLWSAWFGLSVLSWKLKACT